MAPSPNSSRPRLLTGKVYRAPVLQRGTVYGFLCAILSKKLDVGRKERSGHDRARISSRKPPAGRRSGALGPDAPVITERAASPNSPTFPRDDIDPRRTSERTQPCGLPRRPRILADCGHMRSKLPEGMGQWSEKPGTDHQRCRASFPSVESDEVIFGAPDWGNMLKPGSVSVLGYRTTLSLADTLEAQAPLRKAQPTDQSSRTERNRTGLGAISPSEPQRSPRDELDG